MPTSVWTDNKREITIPSINKQKLLRSTLPKTIWTQKKMRPDLCKTSPPDNDFGQTTRSQEGDQTPSQFDFPTTRFCSARYLQPINHSKHDTLALNVD